MRLARTILTSAALSLLIVTLAGAQGTCSWSAMGAGLPDNPSRLGVFDLGNGPTLYAGSWYSTASWPSYVRWWNGTSWVPLNDPQAEVRSMAAFDDGTGPTLYIGDNLHVKKWTGSMWQTIGSFADDIHDLVTYDDGTGPALYAVGDFGNGAPVSSSGNINRWNGSSWAGLGAGLSSWTACLAVFDDGTGPALYAGGTFNTAGGVPAKKIAKWNGSVWSAVGGGFNDGGVYDLHVFDDGTGPKLIAAGYFTSPYLRVASWDGTSWTQLGAGFTGPQPDGVHHLTTYDDGSGPALYAFRWASGGPGTYGIYKWDGTSWSLPHPNIDISDLVSLSDATGTSLVAGGGFSSIGGVSANKIARWSCGPATPQFQSNSVLANLAVNGVWGTAYCAATVTVPIGGAATLQLGSLNIGMAWELGLGLAPLVPAGSGGLVTVDNQIFNVDLSDPAFTVLWNFFQSSGFQNATIPFSVPNPATLSTQMLVLEPALPSGLVISQPTRLIVQ